MKKYPSITKHIRGFSLIEVVVGVAVFTVIIFAVYGAYTSIFNIVYTSRAKLDAVDLIDEQLEIIRNMPYSEVGILNGIPNGVLSHTQTLTRDSNVFTLTTYIRNIDDPFDGTLGGTPNDTTPADYKSVEIDVGCAACHNFVPVVVTTTVAPKGLETASTNGALFIKVFDANGNPIENANVHVVNSQVSPTITIDDVTNVSGLLEIVDAPPGVNAYQITVTKPGYSTDGTATSSVSNPNPVKPNATVAVQQVTSVSFSIDKLSTMTVNSETAICSPVSSMDFQLTGSKLLGTPAVYKYNQSKITDSTGALAINNLEWDSYAIVGIDGSYDVVGINPLSPVSLAPNATQAVQLIVAPKNPDTLLITVRDSSASNGPLSGATVTVTKAGYSSTQTTGLGVLTQTDWSGGAGQATSTIPTSQYFAMNGNIETNAPAGDMVLKKIFGNYVASGQLTSSSFDTGSASNFQTIGWLPGSQPPATGATSIGFQVATNDDGATWNFAGPDGTASTYYTSSNQNINPLNNGNQYFRYKLFESTASTTVTPDISDVSFTFTSACTPPGQVAFSGLSSGLYTVQVSKNGYASTTQSINVNSGWMNQDIIMVPN